jgi:hypothetical protein
VWAHSNLIGHGHGVANKAHDCYGTLACSSCHEYLDNGGHKREYLQWAFRRGMDRTYLYLFEHELIGVL